jgi:hypothetical protein
MLEGVNQTAKMTVRYSVKKQRNSKERKVIAFPASNVTT